MALAIPSIDLYSIYDIVTSFKANLKASILVELREGGWLKRYVLLIRMAEIERSNLH
jgi:hypothetical protein